MHAAYDEILDFVTSAPSLMEIVNFTHSFATQERVTYLLMAEERGALSHDEAHELHEFQKAAYFVDQLKIRAHRRLQGDSL
jgi:hypothetical protein